MKEWKTIDTAPKDGSKIACWDGNNLAFCEYFPCKATGNDWIVCFNHEDNYWEDYTPTHWHELDSPPKKGE